MFRVHLIALFCILFCTTSVFSEKLSRPQKAIWAYDARVSKMNGEFSKVPAEPTKKTWVKLKIAHMYAVDQFMREQSLLPDTEGYNDDERAEFWELYGSRWRGVDEGNTRDIKQIFEIHGWFKISEFGEKTDRQAWLLVQHADHDRVFQKEVLEVLEELFPLGETHPTRYAYLYDRVAASWQSPDHRTLQRYGTQGQCVAKGQWEPIAIEDVEKVNQRRAEVGLKALEEYVQQNSERFCRNFESPPSLVRKKVCDYSKQTGCQKNEVCAFLNEGSFCQIAKSVSLVIGFPFSRKKSVFCDQGVFSPKGNSHSYNKMVFALDLHSQPSQPPAKILAAASGVVYAYDKCEEQNTKCGNGFGNVIKIFAEDGVMVFNAHLEKVFVKSGDTVEKGQVIGLEGTTGWTGKDNRHLHFSVHSDWRGRGIEFYSKNPGITPQAVTYKMNSCQPQYATCTGRPLDVRDIYCHRVTGRLEPIQAH